MRSPVAGRVLFLKDRQVRQADLVSVVYHSGDGPVPGEGAAVGELALRVCLRQAAEVGVHLGQGEFFLSEGLLLLWQQAVPLAKRGGPVEGSSPSVSRGSDLRGRMMGDSVTWSSRALLAASTTSFQSSPRYSRARAPAAFARAMSSSRGRDIPRAWCKLLQA